VGDRPEDLRGHRPAEVSVQLGEPVLEHESSITGSA
jgi:hypothetical protein